MKNVKKILALVLALVMLAIVCVGCSKTQTPATNDGESTSSEQTQGEAGGEQTTQPQENVEAPAETVKFTYMRGVWGPATFTKGGQYEQDLKDLANVEVDVQIIPIVEYDAKVKTIVAGGDLPDMMMAFGPTDPWWRDLENQGAFAPLDEYLDKYPILWEIAPESVWEMLRNPDDGHIYFIPQTCVAEMPFFVYYRQDWFEELGIKEPITIAELETALETIKQEMPDVVPLTSAAGATAWLGKDLATSFGCTVSGWTPDENGNLQPDYCTEEAADFAFWLQDMQARGLLDADCGVNPDVTFGEQRFKTGRAAVIMGVFNQISGYLTELDQNDPDAKIGIIGPLAGPNGTQGGTRVSFPVDRGYYFSGKAENLDGIMQFLAWTLGEGNDFRKYGIEGKTYTVDANGNKVGIPDTEREDDYVSSQIEPLTFVHRPEDNFNWDDYKLMFETIGHPDFFEYFQEKWDAYCAVKYYDYKNPTVFSDINNDIGAQLNEAYLSAYWWDGIITNPKVTRDEVSRAVEDWKAAGGQSIIDEFNALQADKSQPNY